MSKTATVYSDDPQNPQIALKVEGTVTALIDVRPSTTVIFRGMAENVPESVIDLTGSTVPFHLTRVESDLDANIAHRIETVENGKHYRLRVTNTTKRGNYRGYLKVFTDLPQKPDILITVSAFIEGEVSVKPQAVLIGKLSADQPERPGRITVTGNRNVPFEITRLGYDERLLTVTQHQLDDETGYVIEISPRLESVQAGTRQQTTLTIETSAAPGEKETVQVHLFNSVDQPEAKSAPR